MNRFLSPLGPSHTSFSTVSSLNHVSGTRVFFQSVAPHWGCGSSCRRRRAGGSAWSGGTGRYCRPRRPKDLTATRAAASRSHCLQDEKLKEETGFIWGVFNLIIFFGSHLFLFTSSTTILIRVITLDQVKCNDLLPL